jgi:hypothetical protein
VTKWHNAQEGVAYVVVVRMCPKVERVRNQIAGSNFHVLLDSVFDHESSMTCGPSVEKTSLRRGETLSDVAGM